MDATLEKGLLIRGNEHVVLSEVCGYVCSDSALWFQMSKGGRCVLHFYQEGDHARNLPKEEDACRRALELVNAYFQGREAA